MLRMQSTSDTAVVSFEGYFSPVTFHLGFVHSLQDVAFHQCLLLSSVWFFPVPDGSLFPWNVVLPSSAWSSSWSLPSPWFCHSVQHLVHLLSFILAICPAHLHFVSVCILQYQLSLFFSWSLSMVSCLAALDSTFSSPLLFEWFLVCLSVVYCETMFSSRRSVMAKHIGPLLVFLSEMGSCLSWSFFQNSSTLLWSWHRCLLL